MAIIIYTSFFFRLILSTIHSEISYLPGATYDAITYHKEALEFYDLLKSGDIEGYKYERGWIYSAFLGFLYFIFSPSFLLANYLSCFVWLLSSLILKRLVTKLNYTHKSKLILIFIYSYCFPILTIYSSITLREVYILLLINIFLFSIISFLLEKKPIIKIYYLIIIFIVALLLLILHRSNLYFLILFFSIMFLYFVIVKFKLNIYIILSIILFSIIPFHLFGILEIPFNMINGYQSGHFNSFDFFRADYYSAADVKNRSYTMISFFAVIFGNFYNYMFQPTIFKVSNVADILLWYENILRVTLLTLGIARFSYKFKRIDIFNIFLISFVLMEFVYAQGTINWGTASRHHLPVIGALVLLAFYPSKKYSNEKYK